MTTTSLHNAHDNFPPGKHHNGERKEFSTFSICGMPLFTPPYTQLDVLFVELSSVFDMTHTRFFLTIFFFLASMIFLDSEVCENILEFRIILKHLAKFNCTEVGKYISQLPAWPLLNRFNCQTTMSSFYFYNSKEALLESGRYFSS